MQNTLENQKILVDLANDKSKYIGTDIYGNNWNINYNNSGEQIWVRYRNNVINEGGINKISRKWDDNTGLNSNPKRNNSWRKKK